MKIIMINSTNYSSTGNIMLAIADECRKNGYLVTTVCPEGLSMHSKIIFEHIYVGTRLERNLHLYAAKLTGFNGCFSFFSTIRFILKIKKQSPDIIHLHNLHNCYINLPLLFRYIKKHQIKTVWTLHDCWAFTGQCPYFTMVQCCKWKTGCFDCPSYREYPSVYFDRTKTMWRLKKMVYRYSKHDHRNALTVAC